MPLRGRATARNFPKFLDGLRSHIRSCSLEGPRLSRDQPPRGADGWRCFSAVGPSAVGIQWRALPAWPQPGADRTWLHHTLMETRSPSRWRVQRTSRRIRCGLDTSLGPPTVLGNKAAAQVSCAREVQVRGRGSTRHPDVTAPEAEESARASTQRPGLRAVEPPGAYACHDAGAHDCQSIGPRLLPSRAREAPGSPAPLPRAGEDWCLSNAGSRFHRS
jgi:hypothetical protein